MAGVEGAGPAKGMPAKAPGPQLEYQEVFSGTGPDRVGTSVYVAKGEKPPREIINMARSLRRYYILAMSNKKGDRYTNNDVRVDVRQSGKNWSLTMTDRTKSGKSALDSDIAQKAADMLGHELWSVSITSGSKDKGKQLVVLLTSARI